MALNAYLTDTSRILHDPNNVNFSVSDLTAYINTGRGQIANTTQCVRKLNIVTLNSAQETYSLPNPNASGVGQAIAILGIAVPWGTYKPTLDRYSWQDFQSYFRLFTGTVSGFPECYGQMGDASNGLVYFFPIPGQTFASEWDCAHTVLPLAADTDPEALPYPFTDAVPYYAAYRALLNAQRYQESKAMKAEYADFMKAARAATNPLFVGTAYPDVPGGGS